VIGGNFLAALIGVTAARFIPLPLGAAAMAVATTITVTSLLGCPERADLARRNVE
jgi:CBS domain-containing membrane protein